MAHMLKLWFLAYAPNKLYGGLDKKAKYCIIKINRGCLPLQKFAFAEVQKLRVARKNVRTQGGIV